MSLCININAARIMTGDPMYPHEPCLINGVTLEHGVIVYHVRRMKLSKYADVWKIRSKISKVTKEQFQRPSDYKTTTVTVIESDSISLNDILKLVAFHCIKFKRLVRYWNGGMKRSLDISGSEPPAKRAASA